MVGRRSVSIAIIGLGLLSGSVRAAPLAPPGLTVTRVTASQQGRTLRIRDVVHNNGPKTSPPSTTGYYLGRVWIGARRVGQLAPGMSSIGAVTLRIPRTLRPGAYRLRACADDHYKLRLIHCRAATQQVIAPDRTPPVFTGLTQAVTCVPGPIVPGRSSRYALNWTAASDDGTPRSGIVYGIYQATTPGSENFTTPTCTSTPGATTFTTPSSPTTTAGTSSSAHATRPATTTPTPSNAVASTSASRSRRLPATAKERRAEAGVFVVRRPVRYCPVLLGRRENLAAGPR